MTASANTKPRRRQMEEFLIVLILFLSLFIHPLFRNVSDNTAEVKAGRARRQHRPPTHCRAPSIGNLSNSISYQFCVSATAGSWDSQADQSNGPMPRGQGPKLLLFRLRGIPQTDQLKQVPGPVSRNILWNLSRQNLPRAEEERPARRHRRRCQGCGLLTEFRLPAWFGPLPTRAV